MGDCRVKIFALLNDFVYQTEVGTGVIDNKRSVLYNFNHWRELTYIIGWYPLRISLDFDK